MNFVHAGSSWWSKKDCRVALNSEVTESNGIVSKIKKILFKTHTEKSSSSIQINSRLISKINKAKNLESVLKLDLPDSGRDLVNALNSENLDESYSLKSFSDMSVVGEIISKNITKIERTKYRTFKYSKRSENGYDLVKYDIFHPDGTVSIIIAGRQSDNPYSYYVGGLDLRDTHYMIYTSREKDEINFRWYENNNLKKKLIRGDYNQGIEAAQKFIEDSISHGGIKKFQDTVVKFYNI